MSGWRKRMPDTQGECWLNYLVTGFNTALDEAPSEADLEAFRSVNAAAESYRRCRGRLGQPQTAWAIGYLAGVAVTSLALEPGDAGDPPGHLQPVRPRTRLISESIENEPMYDALATGEMTGARDGGHDGRRRPVPSRYASVVCEPNWRGSNPTYQQLRSLSYLATRGLLLLDRSRNGPRATHAADSE